MTVERTLREILNSLGYTRYQACQSPIVTGRAEYGSKCLISCQWEAHTHAEGTLLTLDVRFIRKSLLSAAILLMVPSILAAIVAIHLIIAGSAAAKSRFFPPLILTAAMGFGWLYYFYTKWTTYLAKKEGEIWRAFEQRYPCEKVLPVRKTLLGEKLEFGMMSFLYLLVCTGCVRLAPITVLPIIFITSILFPYSLAAAWLRIKPFLQWRLQVLKCMLSLAFLSFTSLFFLCIFFICHITVVSSLSNGSKSQLYYLLKTNYILSSGENTSPKAIVQKTLQGLIDKEVAKLSHYYNMPQNSVEKLRKSVTAKIICIVFLITLFYLLLLMCALIVILRAPWDWQEASAKIRPIPFLVPPVTLKKHGHGCWQRFLLAIFLANFGILNLISLFASIDIIHFLFTGSCFFKPLGIALQWISLPFSEFITTTINVPSIMHPYVKTILLLSFVVPTLTICFSKIINFSRKVFWAVLGKVKLLYHGAVIPQDVPEITKDLSLKAGVSVPQIKLLFDRKIRLFIQKRLWHSKAKIYITTGAVEKLNQEELEATIAHEISHLRQGLFHIELARLLSWLLFFPNGSWHSLIDFVEREFDADRQAIQLTKKRKPLISALLKASLNIGSQKSRKTLIRSNNKILSQYYSFKAARQSFDKFLSDDSMVGYTYPYITERIQVIQNSQIE